MELQDVNIKIPKELYSSLEQVAEATGISTEGFISAILILYAKKHGLG